MIPTTGPDHFEAQKGCRNGIITETNTHQEAETAGETGTPINNPTGKAQ